MLSSWYVNRVVATDGGWAAAAVLSVVMTLVGGMAWGAGRGPVAWERGATEVIVRYETSGGRATRVGTHVPVFTLYGDGLVVWTDNNAEPTPGLAASVWTGRMEPAAILTLLATALESGFFELEDSYYPGPPTRDLTGLSDTETVDPIPLPLDVGTETLSISLVNRNHRVRVRPVGWPEAPPAFLEVRELLLSLEPRESRRFVPQAYRLSVMLLEGEDAGGYSALPPSLSAIDLAAGSVAPLTLGRAEGEAMGTMLDELGAKVLRSAPNGSAGMVLVSRSMAENGGCR